VLVTTKLERTVVTERQVEEVMTDFWFNHFNVFGRKDGIGAVLEDYEWNAIRAHVFGRFEDMLLATARHPAMLMYLDAAAPPDSPHARPGVLNENYARELLELHTLGVHGGYTQADVIAVGRAFTGWSVIDRPVAPVEAFLQDCARALVGANCRQARSQFVARTRQQQLGGDGILRAFAAWCIEEQPEHLTAGHCCRIQKELQQELGLRGFLRPAPRRSGLRAAQTPAERATATRRGRGVPRRGSTTASARVTPPRVVRARPRGPMRGARPCRRHRCRHGDLRPLHPAATIADLQRAVRRLADHQHGTPRRRQNGRACSSSATTGRTRRSRRAG
jgi:hypothetical protein